MKLSTDAFWYKGGIPARSSTRCSRTTSAHWHFSAPEIPSRSGIFHPAPPQIAHVSTAFIAPPLPTDGLSLVLFIQPLLQRSEIIQDRRRVHLLLPGQSLERLRPGLALAHGQHRVEPVPRRLAFVYGAAIQRS